MKKSPVVYLSIASLLFLVLAFLAYPGSTYYDHAVTHYRIFQNSISESGMTKNYRGDVLVWSRIFFTIALFSGGGALSLFFHKKIPTFLAILTGLLFISIPFFPTDTYNALHNWLFFAGVLALLVSFTTLSVKTKKPFFILTSSVLLVYVLFLIFNPNTVASPTVHLIHVTAQKIVLLWVFLTVIWQEI